MYPSTKALIGILCSMGIFFWLAYAIVFAHDYDIPFKQAAKQSGFQMLAVAVGFVLLAGIAEFWFWIYKC